jgi:hypothetical protein
MLRFLSAFALVTIGLASAATAQTAESFDPSEVRRLSPEEKERILAENEQRAKEAEFDAALGRSSPRPGIHGEIGGVIGTGGTRGIFGTALVPLGDSGSAIFSFEDFRTDGFDRRDPRRRIVPK